MPHPEGVPLNIWQVAARSGHVVRTNLAMEAIAGYSQPGAVVVDVIPGRGEVLATAITMGRSAVALDPELRCRNRAMPGLEARADLVVALPPADRLAPVQPCHVSPLAARLVVGRACRLLADGGHLAVGVVARPGHDDLGATVERARAEGLAYFQHVVALICHEVFPERANSVPVRRIAHVDVLVFEARR